jgi:hypothetical protein
MDCHHMDKELRSVTSLIDAQKDAGIPKDVAMKSLVTSWKRRLSSLPPLQADQITTLTTAINSGPWCAEDRVALATMLLDKQDNNVAMGGPKTRRSMQKCSRFENMITEREWRAVRTLGILPAAVIQILALRAWLIGIECPSEKECLKRMVAIYAFALRLDLAQTPILDVKTKLSAAITGLGTKRDVKLPFLTEYPVSAKDLPEDIKAYAYPEPNQFPVDVNFPELDCILGTSKIRGGKSNSWMQNVPDKYQKLLAMHMKGSMDLRIEPDKEPSASSAYNPAPAPYVRDQSSIAFQNQWLPQKPTMGPPRPSCARAPLALQDAPAAIDDDDDASKGSEASLVDLEEMEREMLSAVKGRSVSKKPAIAPQAAAAVAAADGAANPLTTVMKAAPAVKARPKPVPAALKRPASSVAKPAAAAKAKLAAAPAKAAPPMKNAIINIDMSDVFDGMRVAFGEGISQNAFKCRAYNRAENRALNKGHDAETAKEFAREMHLKAKDLWVELSA